MDNLTLSYSPGKNSVTQIPLGRYLPPIPGEMIFSWLNKLQKNGKNWILDPFGTTPILGIEAAKAGYNTFVFCNNPILGFMFKTLTQAPHLSDFHTALAFLSKERWYDTRLEIHLKSLYQTTCEVCSEKIQVIYYSWNESESVPYSKNYKCPYCGSEGEFPINEWDRMVLDDIKTDQMQRARAIQRVVGDLDPNIENVKNILETYLPRQLYFVQTLQNRIDRASIPPPFKNLLTALLISTFDKANALWPKNSSRSRPKQIGIPTQFKEFNLWEIFENSANEWTLLSEEIPFSIWPNLPETNEGGICLFEGRIRDLEKLPELLEIKYAISVLPRPNQAFWSYSALWSGWLWGKQAVRPVYASLSRLRYDWNWLATAYYSIFSALKKTSASQYDLLTLMTEAEPGFFSALVAGAKCSGYKLEGSAFRKEDKIMQTHWKPQQHMQPPLEEHIPEMVQSSLVASLNNRNEPLDYFDLFNQAIFTYENINETLKNCNSQPSKFQKQFQEIFTKILANQKIWKKYHFQEKNPESGLWWLKDPKPVSDLTLSDRIEAEILSYLNKHPKCCLHELDNHLCSIFKGFFTPSSEIILNCLLSYASQTDENSFLWSLNTNEIRELRQKDIEQVKSSLAKIGKKLGYIPRENHHLFWENKNGGAVYEFVVLSTAIISPYCLNKLIWKAENKFIVIPGSRSQLLLFKLDHDPRLKEVFNKEFHFLKFRHIQNISERPYLDLTKWNELIYLDPPDFTEPKQISLF